MSLGLNILLIFIFLVLFAALLVAEISILCKQIKIGPEKE